MRVLAIDYGTKRVGIAVSDPTGIIAQPLEFILAEPADKFWSRLDSILKEKEVGRIIVGMPRNMDGSFGPAAQRVEGFVGELRAKGPIPVQTLDERLTTRQAERVLIQGNTRREKRKEKIDQTAAAILLQSYLDSQAALGSEEGL